MAIFLAAVAVTAIVGGAAIGAANSREVGKANEQIAANNIEIVKFQSRQKRAAIHEGRSMIAGQIVSNAAASGVAIGSISVENALMFNATQRGTEIGNVLIETEAEIANARSGARIGSLAARGESIGQIVGAVGQGAAAAQGFF